MISFIIPTLNEEKVIEETLRNLSSYHNSHEIIISDGGSTDLTLEITKNYNCKIVQHLETHKQTIAEGRNEGAFLSVGNYIVEMDADTRFPNINEFFRIMVDVFDKNPNIVGATTWFRVYPEDETFFDRLIFRITCMVSLVLNNYLGLSSTRGGEFQMVRADAFRKIGGYNKNVVAMEDNEMFSRLRKLGRIYFEKDLFIYHSGRRAHILGWPRLIFTFIINSFYLLVFKKVKSKTWKVVR